MVLRQNSLDLRLFIHTNVIKSNALLIKYKNKVELLEN